MAIVLVTTVLFSASVFAGESSIYHVVLVDLKDGVTPEQVKEMFTVGKALIYQIPGILEVSFGQKALENRDAPIKDYDVGLCVKWEKLEMTKSMGLIFCTNHT